MIVMKCFDYKNVEINKVFDNFLKNTLNFQKVTYNIKKIIVLLL